MAGVRLGLQLRCGGPRDPGAVGEATVDRPELAVGDRRLVFPATLRSGERLVYFPGEAPYVVPAAQAERVVLAPVADIVVPTAQDATVRLPAGTTGAAAFRWVLDCPEEHALPEGALATPLPKL
jgi:hypothetical protein